MKMLLLTEKSRRRSLFQAEARVSSRNHAQEETTQEENGLGKERDLASGIALDKYSFFDSNLLCLIASSDETENNTGHSQLVARYCLRLAATRATRVFAVIDFFGLSPRLT